MTARFTDHVLPPGLLADRPVASAVPEGALYPATDTNIIYQSDGTTWATWRGAAAGGVESIVPGTNVTVDDTDPANPVISASGGGGGGGTDRPLVDPTGLSWSWVNQGAASVVNPDSSIVLSAPIDGADNWHLRAKALPATPYSAIIHWKPSIMAIDYTAVGVGWLNSSNNHFLLFCLRGGSLTMEVASATSGGFALTANHGGRSAFVLWEWVKLTDDGTTRKIYVSRDGNDWREFWSAASNTILTPNRLAFGVNVRNSSYSAGVTLDSWEEGA